MMLIKALGKVGCKYLQAQYMLMMSHLISLCIAFIVNQISEPVKKALFSQLNEILKTYEFIDFILSFQQEAIQNYASSLSSDLCN